MSASRTHRTALDQPVLVPGDDAFDHARRAWNLAVDQWPSAIVAPTSPEDVAHAVAIAQERGLRIAAQGTGHGAAALGSLEDTILVKTDRMRAIHVDPRTRIARLEAGVIWQEAVDAAARHGLALLAGSAPDVGVVGYTLGGGLSWLGRRHGLTCNSVHAVELVTAEGRLVRADRDHEPDLFWALRGGGGSFGVVTAVELEALAIQEVYAGILWWPIERGEEVFRSWRELAESDPPDEFTSLARYLQVPPLPEIPEPLRGRSFVVVEAFHLGDTSLADELLAPLRALAPVNDTIDTIPVEALAQVHMDPDQPAPFVGDGLLLADLPEEAIDELDRIAGPGASSPLVSVEVIQLGGALGRPEPGHGVLASIDAQYALFGLGMAPTPEHADAVRAHLEQLKAGLAPWAAGRMYLNFAETRRDPATLWGERTVNRLRQVKAKYDPGDLFRSNHPVGPPRVP